MTALFSNSIFPTFYYSVSSKGALGVGSRGTRVGAPKTAQLAATRVNACQNLPLASREERAWVKTHSVQ